MNFVDQKSLAAGADVERRAKTQYGVEISKLLERNRERKARVKPDLIAMVNDDRLVGLYLKEWRGKEQMELEFMNHWLRENQGAIAAGLSLEEADKCIKLANRFPDGPVTEFEELAAGGIQGTFVSAGLLPAPVRGEPQNPGERTPLIVFIDTMGSARERLAAMTRDLPVTQMQPETIWQLKAELKPLVEFYQALPKGDGE